MLRRVLVLLWLALVTVPGAAQTDDLKLKIEQGYAGLDGYIRPGAWTPIRLSVDNLAADDRDVWVSWEHRDEDGDRVVARRRVTLTRQRDDQPVWLYAAVPRTTSGQTTWNLRAVDAESGRLLASLTVQPNAEALLRGSETLVAVTSTADLGLNDFQRHETGHTPVRLVRGLSLSRVPDRWQGLDTLHALIWTQDGGDDPADPLQVSEASLLSLREWVFRGGHLVVMLPEVGQTWTGSALADMLPVGAGQLRPIETDQWPQYDWLRGLTRPEEPESLTVTTFDVEDDDPRAAVLLRDERGRPIAVAGRYGFGRVTVVGVDLTAPAVRNSLGLHIAQRRLWHDVFNWRQPVLPQQVAENLVKSNELVVASRLTGWNKPVDLGQFIPGQIAMTGTVGALLLGAIFLFGLYWVLAGWLLQPVLKRRGWSRFTWVGFVGVVLVFAGLAWGGAALLRPGTTSVAHVTVLDFDGNTGVARGRAFVSLFVPRFGEAEVATPAADLPGLGGAPHNLISSPGFSENATETGFIDPQRYTIDTAAPNTVGLPMRSTSKQLTIDFLGRVDQETPGLVEPYSIGAPSGITADRNGWPVGEVIHTLPGALTNVRIIVCRGERFDIDGKRRLLRPEVWSYVAADDSRAWESGTPLDVGNRPGPRDPNPSKPLYPGFRTWDDLPENRDWSSGEGLLGNLLGQQQGGTGDLPLAVDESVIARQFELLTFFDALPPPDTKRDPESPDIDGYVVTRRLGQRLDLTPLTQGRRVIILGHLKNSPLPLPLTVDGQTPQSNGWTVVRWVYDF